MPVSRNARLREDVGDEAPKITKTTVVARYCNRMDMVCHPPQLHAALSHYTLLRFSAEVDQDRQGALRARRGRPRVMNLKPYLQLDVT